MIELGLVFQSIGHAGTTGVTMPSPSVSQPAPLEDYFTSCMGSLVKLTPTMKKLILEYFS